MSIGYFLLVLLFSIRRCSQFVVFTNYIWVNFHAQQMVFWPRTLNNNFGQCNLLAYKLKHDTHLMITKSPTTLLHLSCRLLVFFFVRFSNWHNWRLVSFLFSRRCLQFAGVCSDVLFFSTEITRAQFQHFNTIHLCIFVSLIDIESRVICVGTLFTYVYGLISIRLVFFSLRSSVFFRCDLFTVSFLYLEHSICLLVCF